MSQNQRIDDLAAEWVAKGDLRALSAQEQAELEIWLAADIRHLGAYAKAKAIGARLERMRGISMFQTHAHATWSRQIWSRRAIVLGGGIAASFAAAGFVGRRLWKTTSIETLTTGIGQTREVLLNDGSAITLNTNTKLAVNFTSEMRLINLVRGEALFEVATDKARPFVVSANKTQVRAVGTSFAVSVLPKMPVQVLVREGVVEFKRIDRIISAPVRVSANVRATAPTDAPIITAGVSDAKLKRDLAWETGRIAFDNETLQKAAEEFARYSPVRLVVDPSVAHRTITGLFASNDPIGFAKATATLLEIQVRVEGGEVKLFQHAEEKT